MSKQKVTISSKLELRRTKGERSSSKTPKQCLIQRLPLEVLGKILHYLDASSLFCISHVNKFFNRLANDDIIWLKLYVSEIGEGGKVWRPKGPVGNTAVPGRRSAAAAAVLAGAEEAPPRRAPGHWKRRYLTERAGYDVSEWLRDLRAISPYTGLPSQTESLLRKRRVAWELTLTPRAGRAAAAFEPSQVRFFPSSVAVCWSHSRWPPCSQVAALQVHAVVRVALAAVPRLQRPGWRSLLGSFDGEELSERSPLVGHDALVKVLVLQGLLVGVWRGLLVGVWRGTTSIAFVIACFHFHRLVERCLLGSSICPYSGAVNKAPFDDIDPEYGLHGYTLHMVLHSTVAEIMSGQFSRLFCRKAQIQNGHIELVAISRADLSQHTPLSGDISLPWRCEGLEGTLEALVFSKGDVVKAVVFSKGDVVKALVFSKGDVVKALVFSKGDAVKAVVFSKGDAVKAVVFSKGDAVKALVFSKGDAVKALVLKALVFSKGDPVKALVFSKGDVVKALVFSKGDVVKALVFSKGDVVKALVFSKGDVVKALVFSKGDAVKAVVFSKGDAVKALVFSKGDAVKALVFSKGDAVKALVFSKGDAVKAVVFSKGDAVKALVFSKGDAVKALVFSKGDVVKALVFSKGDAGEGLGVKGDVVKALVFSKGDVVKALVFSKGDPVQPVVFSKGDAVKALVFSKGDVVKALVFSKGDPVQPVVFSKGDPVQPVVFSKGDAVKALVFSKGDPVQPVVFSKGDVVKALVFSKGDPVKAVVFSKGDPVQPVVFSKGDPVQPVVFSKGDPVQPVVFSKGDPVQPVVFSKGDPVQPVVFSKGDVNCCLMSFTLLDEALQPFWCLSSPVHLAPAKRPAAYDYDGEHFSLGCVRPEGRVEMELVRTERQRRLFLIDLRLYVDLREVKRHFGKSY
ncbi:unnamed protein product [Boreogadus saida]